MPTTSATAAASPPVSLTGVQRKLVAAMIGVAVLEGIVTTVIDLQFIGINPNFGRPQGGEVVTITGKNFKTPLRVLFDFGAGKTPKDATIISSTDKTSCPRHGSLSQHS